MDPKIHASKPQWESALENYRSIKDIKPNRFVILNAQKEVAGSYGNALWGSIVAVFTKAAFSGTAKELAEEARQKTLQEIGTRLTTQLVENDELQKIQKEFSNLFPQDPGLPLAAQDENTKKKKALSDQITIARETSGLIHSLEKESDSALGATQFAKAMTFLNDRGDKLDPHVKKVIRDLAQEKLASALQKERITVLRELEDFSLIQAKDNAIKNCQDILKILSTIKKDDWDSFDEDFRKSIILSLSNVLNYKVSKAQGDNFVVVFEKIRDSEKLFIQLKALCNKSELGLLEDLSKRLQGFQKLFIDILTTTAPKEIASIDHQLQVRDKQLAPKEKVFEKQLSQSKLKGSHIDQMRASLAAVGKIEKLQKAHKLLDASSNIALLLNSNRANSPEGLQDILENAPDLRAFGIKKDAITSAKHLREQLAVAMQKQLSILQDITGSDDLQKGLKTGIAWSNTTREKTPFYMDQIGVSLNAASKALKEAISKAPPPESQEKLQEASKLLDAGFNLVQLLATDRANKPDGFKDILDFSETDLKAIGLKKDNIKDANQLRELLAAAMQKQLEIIQKIEGSGDLQMGLKAGIAYFTIAKLETPERTPQALAANLEDPQKQQEILKNQKEALEVVLQELDKEKSYKISESLSRALEQYIRTINVTGSIRDIRAAKPQPIAIEGELEEKLQQAQSPSNISLEDISQSVKPNQTEETSLTFKYTVSFLKENRTKLSKESVSIADAIIQYDTEPQIDRTKYKQLLEKLLSNKELREKQYSDFFDNLISLVDTQLANDITVAHENSRPDNMPDTEKAIQEHVDLVDLLRRLTPAPSPSYASTRLAILRSVYELDKIDWSRRK